MDQRRIFLVGHGRGSNAVDRLSCDTWVAGLATNSHNGGGPVRSCWPTENKADWRELPTIRINPRGGQHHAPFGGPFCGHTKETPKETEDTQEQIDEKWREANECAPHPDPFRPDETEHRCRVYEGCKVPFESCLLVGGHPWPGFEPRGKAGDPNGCDGEAPRGFNTAKHIVDFLLRAPPRELEE